jgi:hypothetical protein
VTRSWARVGGALTRPTSQGSAVLPAGGSTAATLAGLDGDVWARLDQPLTVDQLVDRLAGHGHGPPLPSAADVQGALERLARRGLVTSP